MRFSCASCTLSEQRSARPIVIAARDIEHDFVTDMMMRFASAPHNALSARALCAFTETCLPGLVLGPPHLVGVDGTREGRRESDEGRRYCLPISHFYLRFCGGY